MDIIIPCQDKPGTDHFEKGFRFAGCIATYNDQSEVESGVDYHILRY